MDPVARKSPADFNQFQFTRENVKRLKEKYSLEMKDHPDNPIKVCMKLVFDAAIEKNQERRNQLAQDLSGFLTKPDGVINLFLALIDFDTSSQKVSTHNQRFVAVANIITRLPKLCLPYEDYCKNIGTQLKPLIASDNPQYANLASIILKSMVDSPHAKGKDIARILLDPIFDGLRLPDCPTKPHESIIAIHNLTITVHHIEIKSFVPIFPHLFYALAELYNTPSRLKLHLNTCLIEILNGLTPGAACCLMEKTMFFSQNVSSLFAIDEEESEITVKVVKENEIDYVTYSPRISQIVINLLESCNNELLILEFFFHFKETMWSANEEHHRQMSSALIEPLLNQSIEEKARKLDLLSIIANNISKSLELISRLILNYLSFMRSKQRKEDLECIKNLSDQSMISCCKILEVLSSLICKENDINILRKRCIPTLKEIYSLLEKENEHESDLFNDLSSLLEWLGKNQENKRQEKETVTCDRESETELDDINKDLNDKLVPTRVHALVRLKQMMLVNDQLAIHRIPQLSAKVEAFLGDDEPYVFLACINLMTEMALRRTQVVLTRLLELYSGQDLEVQFRINAGEVLVKLIKQMNETTPLYAQQVLDTLMKVCCRKGEQELIIISSLTNMGEICRNLGNSLGKYILDILALVETELRSMSLEVKCAALDLLRTTLMGVDKITIEPIQADIKSMYKLLKEARGHSLDERLCLQADLALDELDRLARELLGVDGGGGGGSDEVEARKLVKNIRVLSL